MRINGINPDNQENQDTNDTKDIQVKGHNFKFKPKFNANIGNKTFKGLLGLTAIIFLMFIWFACNYIVYSIKLGSIDRLINKEYDENVIESTIYIEVDVLTANVYSYSDGIYHTDLGDISGPDTYKNNSLLYVFKDLSDTLIILSQDINTSKFKYVTSEYSITDGKDGIYVSAGDASSRESYLEYKERLEKHIKYSNKSAQNKECLKNSFIIFIILGLSSIINWLLINKSNFNEDNIENSAARTKGKELIKLSNRDDTNEKAEVKKDSESNNI